MTAQEHIYQKQSVVGVNSSQFVSGCVRCVMAYVSILSIFVVLLFLGIGAENVTEENGKKIFEVMTNTNDSFMHRLFAFFLH